MTGKKWAAIAAAIALALPVAATAGNRDMNVVVDGRVGTETRSVVVSLSDLNLVSGQGLRLADARVTRAAKRACGWLDGSIQQPSREYRACFGEALDNARADLSQLAGTQRQG